MQFIEQLYIVVQTVSGSREAEIIARSDRIHSCDADEIINWFSENTAEAFIQTLRPSLFFHPLPSGCFALGRIIPETGKPNRSRKIHTLHSPSKSIFQVRILVIPAEILLLKGNNPLLFEQELRNEETAEYPGNIISGKLESIDIPAVNLFRNTELFDETAVMDFCRILGEFKAAEVIQDISDNIGLLLTLPDNITPLMFLKAVFSLLPICFRPELSFSTEYHISSGHLFRLIFVAEKKRKIEELAALSGVPHKIIAADNCSSTVKIHLLEPYSQFIFQIIYKNDFGFLKRKLEEEYRNAITGLNEISESVSDWEMLHLLAVRYFEEFHQNPEGLASSGHKGCDSFSGFENIKPIARSSASLEHILALLKYESKHLMDLIAESQKTK